MLSARSKMILLSSSLVSPPVLVCYLALTRSLLTLLRPDHFSDRCEICYLLDVFENQMEEKVAVAAMKKSRDDDSLASTITASRIINCPSYVTVLIRTIARMHEYCKSLP